VTKAFRRNCGRRYIHHQRASGLPGRPRRRVDCRDRDGGGSANPVASRIDRIIPNKADLLGQARIEAGAFKQCVQSIVSGHGIGFIDFDTSRP
jgi:hypothetical protein